MFLLNSVEFDKELEKYERQSTIQLTIFIVISIIIAVTIAVVFVCGIIAELKKVKACQNCNKSFAMVEIERRELDKTNISKLEEHDIKDKWGTVIGKKTDRVYGQRITYEITYKCKHCGFLEKKIKNEDKY